MHRVLLTATLIAIKYSEDTFYSNEYYAKVGGIQTNELNKMELEFLEKLDFKVYVSDKEFGKMMSEVYEYNEP
jgi:hypothetical protein